MVLLLEKVELKIPLIIYESSYSSLGAMCLNVVKVCISVLRGFALFSVTGSGTICTVFVRRSRDE